MIRHDLEGGALTDSDQEGLCIAESGSSLRECLDERWQGEQTAQNTLIVTKHGELLVSLDTRTGER